jgi:predicted ATPase
VRMLRFSRLCLLSQHEGKAFSLNFSSEATVLQAGNGFGKSAVLGRVDEFDQAQACGEAYD